MVQCDPLCQWKMALWIPWWYWDHDALCIWQRHSRTDLGALQALVELWTMTGVMIIINCFKIELGARTTWTWYRVKQTSKRSTKSPETHTGDDTIRIGGHLQCHEGEITSQYRSSTIGSNVLVVARVSRSSAILNSCVNSAQFNSGTFRGGQLSQLITWNCLITFDCNNPKEGGLTKLGTSSRIVVSTCKLHIMILGLCVVPSVGPQSRLLVNWRPNLCILNGWLWPLLIWFHFAFGNPGHHE